MMAELLLSWPGLEESDPWSFNPLGAVVPIDHGIKVVYRRRKLLLSYHLPHNTVETWLNSYCVWCKCFSLFLTQRLHLKNTNPTIDSAFKVRRSSSWSRSLQEYPIFTAVSCLSPVRTQICSPALRSLVIVSGTPSCKRSSMPVAPEGSKRLDYKTQNPWDGSHVSEKKRKYKECLTLWRTWHIYVLQGQYVDFNGHCVLLPYFCAGTAWALNPWCTRKGVEFSRNIVG